MAHSINVNSYKCIVAAPHSTRNMWSLANKDILEATACHAIKSVDEMTSPKIGAILARASTSDFESLGVLVQTITEVTDASTSTRLSEHYDNNSQNKVRCPPTCSHKTVPEANDNNSHKNDRKPDDKNPDDTNSHQTHPNHSLKLNAK